MRFNSHNRSCLQVNCLADALFICLLSGLSLNEYACSVHPLFYYKYICSVLKIAAPYLNHARTEEYFVAALKQLLILLRRNYTFTGEVPQFDGASSLNSSYSSVRYSTIVSSFSMISSIITVIDCAEPSSAAFTFFRLPAR